jgi:hypothetical protein
MVLRCRLRTLTIIILLLALALGIAAGIQRRRTDMLHLGRYHRMAALHLLVLANWTRGGLSSKFFSESDIEKIARESETERSCFSDEDLNRILLKASSYHSNLIDKYCFAWTHPWSPVGPDPPAPLLAFPDVPAVADPYGENGF